MLLVSPSGGIVWQYGQFGVTGSGANQLNTPVQSTWLPDSHVLITDQGNQRIIEVTLENQIVWQYGTTGVAGNGPNQLNSPNSAELLANGNILIADENNNRVIEVTRGGQIVARFTAGGTLGATAFASRLPSGNTLITDAGNNRVVEVAPTDAVVWQYYTDTDPDSNPDPSPSRGIRLKNGNTIISDQFNDRVIIVNPQMNIVASYGNINDPGFGLDNTSQGLNVALRRQGHRGLHGVDSAVRPAKVIGAIVGRDRDRSEHARRRVVVDGRGVLIGLGLADRAVLMVACQRAALLELEDALPFGEGCPADVGAQLLVAVEGRDELRRRSGPGTVEIMHGSGPCANVPADAGYPSRRFKVSWCAPRGASASSRSRASAS